MRQSIIALVVLLALSGCESAQERTMHSLEKQIQDTTAVDWSGGIPLDDLFVASNSCKKQPVLKGCEAVHAQLQDIATTLSTCRKDQRSSLCRAVIRVIGSHQLASILPQADAVQLPENPFYWNLPTEVLESQARNFGYREEVGQWWWDSWSTILLLSLATLAVAYGGWVFWSQREEEARQHVDLLARRKVERIAIERKLRIQDEQIRAEAERQARITLEAELVKQERNAAELAQKRKADEAKTKLAAEKAVANALLNAVFASAKEKRRERGPSSE